MKFYKNLLVICFIFLLPCLSFSEFIPPENIIEKTRINLGKLNFVKTKAGINYLISDEGRYVFQGELFDIWNGRQINSVPEMDYLKNRIEFKFLGIKPEKMFGLQIGTGEKKAYVFSEPECYYCHKLAKEVKELSEVNNEFSVFFVIVPVLSKTSIEKTRKVFSIAQKDKNKAIECFINNSCENLNDEIKDENLNFDSIDYNRLVARVLSIDKFPFVVNPQGITSAGMPENIFFFLRQE
ncbi:MAG: thioredoxin fold domain-containing protein [Desulforegulaceae bacterium]|nr:thioredoxin fold domain-containing protein [Desulforegulaceae bacterium]